MRVDDNFPANASQRMAPELATLETFFPFPIPQLLGISELRRTYRSIEEGPPELNFFERALHALHVHVDAKRAEIERIPASGPVIIVANHPFGAIDGLAASALALQRHSKVRVIANQWLAKIPQLRPWLLAVDVFGQSKSAAGLRTSAAHARSSGPLSNASVLKAALNHLQNDGLLVLFPAGEVAHFQPSFPGIVDGPWNRLAAALARRSGATVVPMYFEGHNSLLFQMASVVHPNLRTLLLPREMLRRRSTRVKVQVGQPVKKDAIAAFGDDNSLTAWLRLRTYDLALRTSESSEKRTLMAIPKARPSVDIETEIARFSPEALLFEQGQYRAYIARMEECPNTLFEIGRLREITFRAVGEGTGNPIDIDRFDARYRHLFVYDHKQKCIVGGYRLGFCDELLRVQGVSGLYTSMLFKYELAFVRTLEHTIELGRSFVCGAYQRSPLALALLWRGIGQVLARNPEYDRLMGPVSISGTYTQSARRLMISFLENLERDADVKRTVRARRPPRESLNFPKVPQPECNVRQLGRLVAELDSGQRGIPVLLERYLELGGRVLGLNVDPKFGNCVDALIVVHVPSAPEAMLRRFLGPQGLAHYIAARQQMLRPTG